MNTRTPDAETGEIKTAAQLEFKIKEIKWKPAESWTLLINAIDIEEDIQVPARYNITFTADLRSYDDALQSIVLKIAEAEQNKSLLEDEDKAAIRGFEKRKDEIIESKKKAAQDHPDIHFSGRVKWSEATVDGVDICFRIPTETVAELNNHHTAMHDYLVMLERN